MRSSPGLRPGHLAFNPSPATPYPLPKRTALMQPDHQLPLSDQALSNLSRILFHAAEKCDLPPRWFAELNAIIEAAALARGPVE